MDFEQLDIDITKLLLGLPSEITAAVREKVKFFKSKGTAFTPDEIYSEALGLLRLEMLAYLDRRTYLGMYNRRFAEHKIEEWVREIVGRETNEEKELYSLGRITFDLNGLKALNDLAGHDAGNKGLKLFANILNFGATTIWLRDELKFKVVTSAEGGDEFGIVMHGLLDLRKYSEEIVKRYSDEVYAADVSHMINFSDPHVQENLKMLGISSEVPKDYQFRMSTSVGMCLLGEALHRVDVSRMGISFEEMVRDISNQMFHIADKRSQVNKSAFKKTLGEKDPILSGLYARMSKEVIHLERELKLAKEHIRELEAELKKG